MSKVLPWWCSKCHKVFHYDETSRKEVQKLRNKYDAILTSSKTVILDNPSMTCRMKNGRNPIRIVLDTYLSTPKDSKIYENNGAKIYIIVGKHIDNNKIKQHTKNAEFIKCSLKNGHVDLKEAIDKLYEKGIRSILIEAGATLNNAFIQEKLADDIIQFIAPKILSDKTGISFSEGCSRNEIAECNNLIIMWTKKLKNDIMIKDEV